MTERTRLEWAEMNHVHHVATDGTCYESHHPMCVFCNPETAKGPDHELVGQGSGSTEAQRDEADAPGIDRRGEAGAGAPREHGARNGSRSPVVAPIEGLDPAGWGWESRQEYLRTRLAHTPLAAPHLVSAGLWTGSYDSEGLPIPSSSALTTGLWQREVRPVYAGPDRQENKRRSLRDTLITNPECGPRLVSAGLWTGELDDAGMPIPTPQPLEGRRR